MGSNQNTKTLPSNRFDRNDALTLARGIRSNTTTLIEVPSASSFYPPQPVGTG